MHSDGYLGAMLRFSLMLLLLSQCLYIVSIDTQYRSCRSRVRLLARLHT